MVFEWLRKKSLNLEAMLNEGGYMYRYLGVLETYDVEWTLEKVARDTLQNFFDSNKGTLDNVVVEITREERDRVVRIEGQNQYDFRRLLHLGGTTKHGDISTVGGIGEGAKILALVLLRDYGFSQVRFGSGEWELDFSLDAVPKEDYPEKRKGLFACLRKADAEFAGNFVELKTTKQKHLPAFENAKDLFYHS
ncbi:hypothetical protein GOV03_03175, partial [Candidatus Woesearchaeota archaeon]|nr:hypothetical protein [Candidatus Woesearchaeota archaeon]